MESIFHWAMYICSTVKVTCEWIFLPSYCFCYLIYFPVFSHLPWNRNVLALRATQHMYVLYSVAWKKYTPNWQVVFFCCTITPLNPTFQNKMCYTVTLFQQFYSNLRQQNTLQCVFLNTEFLLLIVRDFSLSGESAMTLLQLGFFN